MPELPIVERIEKLEQPVNLLETLPARLETIDAQLLQQRRELQDGFSAIRGEMRAMGQDMRADLRGEMHAVAEGLRAELHAMGDGLKAEILVKIEALDDDLHAEMHALHHLTIERIDAGDAETRRYMRVMVEELITRIETMGEGGRTRKKR